MWFTLNQTSYAEFYIHSYKLGALAALEYVSYSNSQSYQFSFISVCNESQNILNYKKDMKKENPDTGIFKFPTTQIYQFSQLSLKLNLQLMITSLFLENCSKEYIFLMQNGSFINPSTSNSSATAIFVCLNMYILALLAMTEI